MPHDEEPICMGWQEESFALIRESLEVEAKELRENQTRLAAAYHELDNRCDRYKTALAAVREVHHSSTTPAPPYGPGYEVCEGCGWHTGTLGPCPTIAAIDRTLQGESHG